MLYFGNKEDGSLIRSVRIKSGKVGFLVEDSTPLPLCSPSIKTVVQTQQAELCAGEDLQTQFVTYEGKACGENKIEWTSIFNNRPREGTGRDACSWTAATEYLPLGDPSVGRERGSTITVTI
jgi:hypothetical protein